MLIERENDDGEAARTPKSKEDVAPLNPFAISSSGLGVTGLVGVGGLPHLKAAGRQLEPLEVPQ